ncbi:MAG: hypothetical protein PUB21_01895 [Bacteroidales bacterium]|nr:hypothetical protein [Bacteroidales bacterium]
MEQEALPKELLIPKKTFGNKAFSFIYMDGDARKIHIDGKEALQRIYFAVRDKHWLNVPQTIRNFYSSATGYTYHSRFCDGPIDFEAVISCRFYENRIEFEATGKANTSFLKNRIGFCLHIPETLKNTPCVVGHPDHTTTKGTLPLLISPHQPFKNISSLSWRQNGIQISLEFEGDIFEMEDQRNWTDASYKIYSTPLEKPFPVEMKTGETFRQKIILHFNPADRATQKGSPVSCKNNPENIPCPAIGIAHAANLSVPEEKMRMLPFDYYRIDFRFDRKEWKAKASTAIKAANEYGLKIYAALCFTENYEAEAGEFLTFWKEYTEKASLYAVLLLSSDTFVLGNEAIKSIVRILKNILNDVPIGAGTDANFAQLNRNRPDTASIDFLAYSIQPQEHASDPLSLTENIQGQNDTVATAFSFSAHKAIHIASLSLFRRFNANIDFLPKESILPAYTYGKSHFEAGWFLGALHELISSGASAITCIADIGENTPLFHMLKNIKQHVPDYFLTIGSPAPEKYSILAWLSGNKSYALFANHTEEAIETADDPVKTRLKPFEIKFTEIKCASK